MKFYLKMYLNYHWKPREYQGHGSRSHDRIFGLFTIARYGKKFVGM